ncbi:MAG: autotransporter outer membrane beta-barrel domain-containing protein, partial [Campylobacteraceae bacterium]
YKRLSYAATRSISLININYLMGVIETETLLQRMGELELNRDKKDDVWAKMYVGKLSNFKSSLGISKTNYYGLQAGIDRRYQDGYYNGDYYFGFLTGYTRAEIDYNVGDGNVDSYHAGVYGSYKDPNGFYIDSVVKYTHMKNSFNTLTSNNHLVKGTADSNGFGVSLELGKRYKFTDSNFYVEPQAQISYTHQSAMNVESSSGLTTRVYNYDSIITRGRVIFGYKNTEDTNIYFKTGYAKELNGKTAYRFNDEDYLYKLRVNGWWIDNAIGITKSFNNNHHLYLEATYQYGDDFNNIKLNGGYRYGF